MTINNYNVYFEIFNKKLKTTILAESEEKAKQAILNNVIFHKIVIDNKDSLKQTMDTFDNIMDILKIKKKK